MFPPLNVLLSLIIQTYNRNPFNVCVLYTGGYQNSTEIQLHLNTTITLGTFNDTLCSDFIVIEPHFIPEQFSLNLECLVPLRRIMSIVKKKVIFVTDRTDNRFLWKSYNSIVIVYREDDPIIRLVYPDFNGFRRQMTWQVADHWNINTKEFEDKRNLFPGDMNKFGKSLSVKHDNNSVVQSMLYDEKIGFINKQLNAFAQYYNYTLTDIHGVQADYAFTYIDRLIKQIGIEAETEFYISKANTHDLVTCSYKTNSESTLGKNYIFDFGYGMVMVPKPRINENDWVNFIEVFDWRIWMYSGSVFILVRLAFMIQGALYEHGNIQNLEKPVQTLDIFGLLVNQPFNSIPTKMTTRLIQIVALLMMLYFSVMYSSAIVSALVAPTYIKNYQTFDEIMNDKDLHFMDTPFGNTIDKSLKLPHKNNTRNITIQEFIQHFKRFKNQSFDNSVAIVPFYRSAYIESYGLDWSKHRIFPDPITVFPLCMRASNFNAAGENYYPEFITLIGSTGLIAYWENEAFETHNNTFFEMNTIWQPELVDTIVLKFHHVKGIMLGWGIGLIISQLVFMLEFYSFSQAFCF